MPEIQRKMDATWESFSEEEKIFYINSNASQTDCSFLVGKDDNDVKLFKHHKWILSEISNVFETMFNGFFKEAHSSQPVRLDDVAPDTFESFLRFLLYGNLTAYERANVQHLLDLFALAEKYELYKLANLCVGHLVECTSTLMGTKDLLLIWEFIEKYSDTIPEESLQENWARQKTSKQFHDKLVVNVNSLITKSAQNIIRHPSIFDLNLVSLKRLLAQIHGKITAIERFIMLETLAKVKGITNFDLRIGKGKNPPNGKVNCDKVDAKPDGTESERSADINLPNPAQEMDNSKRNEQEILYDLIASTDYSSMTLADFHNGPASSTLLNCNDKYKILLMLVPKFTTKPPVVSRKQETAYYH